MQAFATGLLITLLLTLSSCGFSLRGSDALAAQFSTLSLDLEQANSELSRQLRRSLDVAEVAISRDGGGDIPTLSLRNERVISRPVSVNPRARAAQYEIRLSVDISLLQGQSILIDQETLQIQRSYYEDIENIAGNQEEIAIITAEMRRDLVNLVIRRLEAVAG